VHRRLTFQGDAETVGRLARSLVELDGVIGIAHLREGSLKPPGDLLQVDVLNRSADEVLRRARPGLEDSSVKVTLVISENSAVIDRERVHLIETDADETLWEEIESDLRNHGRVSVNYIVLMALGGAIAAVGLLSDAVPQAIALVGASIIAPGFEPVAKLGQGLALNKAKICGRALWSLVVGYCVLLAAAFVVTFTVSHVFPGRPHEILMSQTTVRLLTHIEGVPVVASACAAVAGIIMVVSLRDLYVVGPLMVLVTISGVALTGAALAIGEPAVALGAIERVGVDMLLIVVLGAAVFFWKQRRFHRRKPIS
jgi:hypothetical protein